jgi:2-aminoadipate transaminase
MEKRYASRMEGLSGNVIRDIFKLIDMPDIISFAGGTPSPSTFPVDDVKRISSHVLDTEGRRILQYGATEGYAPLRATVAGMMKRIGIRAGAENVLAVTGGMQGVDLMCKAFLDVGDAVLVESPTFLGALHTMKLYRPRIIPVPMDAEGMLMDALEERLVKFRPKFIYTIPTFQNPTGKTLGLERRKRMLELARKHGALILEDDPYRDLRYFGEGVPPIAAMDEGLENTAYLMSFSKILSPGLRVGAIIAEPGLHRKLTICKQGVDVHTSLLAQAIASEFVDGGYLARNLPQSIETYRDQLSAMLKGFDAFPAGVSHTKPEGGLFVWAELPGETDTAEVLKEAVKKGVAFIPGASFFTEPGHANTMRLNFSMSDAATITRGMGFLAEVLQSGM